MFSILGDLEQSPIDCKERGPLYSCIETKPKRCRKIIKDLNTGKVIKNYYELNGKKHGLYKEYFPNTRKLRISCNYANGELDGKYTLHHSTKGNVTRITYKAGKLHGAFIEHFDNEYIECTFSKNVLDGEYVRYIDTPEGRQSIKITYFEGYKHGEYEEKIGDIVLKCEYRLNKLHGFYKKIVDGNVIEDKLFACGIELTDEFIENYNRTDKSKG